MRESTLFIEPDGSVSLRLMPADVSQTNRIDLPEMDQETAAYVFSRLDDIPPKMPKIKIRSYQRVRTDPLYFGPAIFQRVR